MRTLLIMIVGLFILSACKKELKNRKDSLEKWRGMEN